MEMGGQLHVPASLCKEDESLCPIGNRNTLVRYSFHCLVNTLSYPGSALFSDIHNFFNITGNVSEQYKRGAC
jgi:hypothetical protein